MGVRAAANRIRLPVTETPTDLSRAIEEHVIAALDRLAREGVTSVKVTEGSPGDSVAPAERARVPRRWNRVLSPWTASAPAGTNGVAVRRFEGIRVLIVGGGADGPPRPGERLAMGNGRAICLRLAAEGASLAVTDRVLTSAEETIAACSGGGPSVAIAADAASPEACVEAVRHAASVLGGIDVVIANVGIASGQSIREQTVVSWDHELAVNLRSHWITAQAALPAMLEQGHGVFVFITSLAAVRGGTGLAYEASKAGQLGVMRHLTVRYAKRGIRSNALMLGLIDSTMVRREFGAVDGRMERRAKAPAMKRQGRPEEVAAACAFLASDDASYVNGTTLVVDGGLSA